MGSSSPGTTTPIQDFESLIPQCFYSYVFLFARLCHIIALSVMIGIVGSLLSGMTQAGEPPATSLVAIMIVVCSTSSPFFFLVLLGVLTKTYRHPPRCSGASPPGPATPAGTSPTKSLSSPTSSSSSPFAFSLSSSAFLS